MNDLCANRSPESSIGTMRTRDSDDALEGIPAKLRGHTPEGAVHSLWQLLEHMRLAQLRHSRFLPQRQLRGTLVNGRVLARAL
jgi:hypothetical protein